MAIAFDAAASIPFTSTSGSPQQVSWSHTCSGSNRGLVVFLRNNGNQDLITTVTYAGVTMAQALKYQEVAGGANGWLYIYYLSNPTAGANNVVAQTGSLSETLAGFSQSYTGVAQGSAMVDNTNTAQGSGTSLTVSVTTIANNCWVATQIRSYTGGETASTGFTQRSNQAGNGGLAGDNNQAQTPPGAVTEKVSWSSSAFSSGMGISIAPFITLSINVSDAETEVELVTIREVNNINVHDTETESESVTVKVSPAAFVDTNCSLDASNYKWMTSTLTVAQQQNAVRPYVTCQIVDDSVVPNQIFTSPGQPVGGQIIAAPDGALLAIGADTSGNLGFWKITDGTNIINWQAAPTVILRSSGNWNPNFNTTIAVSNWINGTYYIDAYYWATSGADIAVNHLRSSNGGISFPGGFSISQGFTIPSGTTDNVFVAAASPTLQAGGLVDATVFYIGTVGSNYAIDYNYYTGTGGFFGTHVQWSPTNADSDDWVLHSLDIFLNNGIYYIVFSGYHSVLESTNGQYSLYLTKLLVRSGTLTSSDVWSYPQEIISSLSSSTQNMNSFTLPKLNYDGTYLWLTCNNSYVLSVSESGTVTTANNYLSMQSVDFQNYTYPTALVFTDGTIFSDTAQNSFAYQNGYYYLGGNGQLWQFQLHNIVADVTNDIIQYQIQETAGDLSNINITIANANNKWFGQSPTGIGYQAIAKNKKIFLTQGYYNVNGVPETVPRNIYFIDDIQQNVSSNQNDFSLQGRDLIKKMRVLTSRFTFNYSGPNLYIDTFGGTTLSNWNQNLGAWTETNNTFTPGTTPTANDFVASLAGINIKKASSMLAVNVVLPPTSGGTVYVYPFYVDTNNWLRLSISGNTVNYTWSIDANVAGTVVNQAVNTNFSGFSPGSTIPIYIKSFGYSTYFFMYGDNVENGINDFYYSIPFKVPASGHPVEVNLAEVFTTGMVATIALGCNFFTAEFSELKFIQYDQSLNVKELITALSTRCGIYSYKFETDFQDYLYNPSNWTGTFTSNNRILHIPASNFVLNNTQQFTDAEIEFDAQMIPINSSLAYGGGLLFRSQSSSTNTAAYEFDMENETDTLLGGSIVSAKFKIRTLIGYDGYPNNSPAILMSSAAENVNAGTITFNDLNFDITQWHHYKVLFTQGWMIAYCDKVLVCAWYDDNKDITYSNGYIGFSANANTNIKVKNVVSTAFYTQIPQYAVNVGDSFEDDIRNVVETIAGWFFSDIFGRLKAVLLNSTDLITYTYNTQLFQQQVDNSDKEYVNEVIVVGQNVSATAVDAPLMGSNFATRDNIVVDYTITTLAGAQDRADFELTNANIFNNQSTPKQIINVGSELLDVVNVINLGNNSSGVDMDVRIYNETFTLGGSSGEYSLQLETGQLS